jgi:FixJ family two-component response regulator
LGRSVPWRGARRDENEGDGTGRAVGLQMTYRCDPAAVHVVDDDVSFRTSMMRVLSAAGLRSIGYGCAGEFLLGQPGETAGCMLLDIAMPGPSGIDLLRALVSRELAPPIIFVTGRDDVYTSVDVMKSGAFDYLVKPVGAERVLPVVRRALQIDAQRRMERWEVDELRRRFDSLTRVERAIFHGIMRNRLNKQLAADLGACERTIKAQRARMMRKLELSTLPELVRADRLLETARDRIHAAVNDTPPADLCASSQSKAARRITSSVRQRTNDFQP